MTTNTDSYPVAGLEMTKAQIIEELLKFYDEAYTIKMDRDIVFYSAGGGLEWGPGCYQYSNSLMYIFMPDFYDGERFEEELLALGGRDEDGQIDGETAKKAWAAVLASHKALRFDREWAENIFNQIEASC